MRALGLDVGMRTIGVAVSDELGLAAHPEIVLTRRGTAHDVAAVIELVRARGPISPESSYGSPTTTATASRARRVRVFTSALEQALPPGVELHEQDERFTTALAERVLIEADVSRARRKDVIDKQAAAVILQGWLDARRARLT